MDNETMNAAAEAENTEAITEETEFEQAFDDNTEESGSEVQTTEDYKEETESQNNLDGAAEETDAHEEFIELDGHQYTKEQLSYLLSNAQPNYPPILNNLAKQAGMNVDEYLAAVEQNARDRQIAQRIEQLEEQGVETELAEYFARIEQEKAQLEEYANGIMNADMQRNAEEARFMQQADAFNKAYPDVDELPDEVIKRIVREEISPIEAYQAYLLKEQQTRLMQLEQKDKNRFNTPGGARGQADLVTDDFITEFDKD